MPSTALNSYSLLSPVPKWGISTRFRILVFSRPSTHCFGCIMGSSNVHVPMISMYTCFTNYRNFLVSATSWSKYISLSTHPSRVGVVCTPSGMGCSTIEASGCLCWDFAIDFFPFLLTDAVEIPSSGSLSSPPDSIFPIISSIFPSSYCIDSSLGCVLDVLDSFRSLSPPFVMWDCYWINR
jgi:hypothetical protein